MRALTSVQTLGALALLLTVSLPVFGFAQEASEPDALTLVLDAADDLSPLRTVLIAQDGEIIADRGYDGHDTSTPTNIKSASKVIISTMVGMAIDRGLLDGTDQPITELLADDLPDDPDPRLADITVGHLLSMQAGLEATSGRNYGRWVASRNWVRSALAQPFTTDPGGAMVYSTGSTHLLSAILSSVGGQTTDRLARDWFADLDGFSVAGWHRDPQGIPLGGNETAMTPHSLLVFGEMIRRGGVTEDDERIVSEDWIDQALTPRTSSRFTRHGYGYGWFLANFGGYDTAYGWGYGGQMLYIVPELDLTVVMTSDPNSPSGGNGHRDRLHGLLADIIEALLPVDSAADPDMALDAS